MGWDVCIGDAFLVTTAACTKLTDWIMVFLPAAHKTDLFRDVFPSIYFGNFVSSQESERFLISEKNNPV